MFPRPFKEPYPSTNSQSVDIIIYSNSPYLSNFWMRIAINWSDKLYPKVWSAFFNSAASMLPEPSTSNARKHRCHSSMYRHSPANSLKSIVPVLSKKMRLWGKFSVMPSTGLFLVSRGLSLACIKHIDHHAHCFYIEWCPIAINQRSLQLVHSQISGSIRIDSFEPVPQLRVSTGRRRPSYTKNC